MSMKPTKAKSKSKSSSSSSAPQVLSTPSQTMGISESNNYPRFHICQKQEQFPPSVTCKALIGSVVIAQSESVITDNNTTRQKGVTKNNKIEFSITSLGSIVTGSFEWRVLCGKNFSNARNFVKYTKGTYGVTEIDGDNIVSLVSDGGIKKNNTTKYVAINKEALDNDNHASDYTQTPLFLTSSGFNNKPANAQGGNTHIYFYSSDPTASISVTPHVQNSLVSLTVKSSTNITVNDTIYHSAVPLISVATDVLSTLSSSPSSVVRAPRKRKSSTKKRQQDSDSEYDDDVDEDEYVEDDDDDQYVSKSRKINSSQRTPQSHHQSSPFKQEVDIRMNTIPILPLITSASLPPALTSFSTISSSSSFYGNNGDDSEDEYDDDDNRSTLSSPSLSRTPSLEEQIECELRADSTTALFPFQSSPAPESSMQRADSNGIVPLSTSSSLSADAPFVSSSSPAESSSLDNTLNFKWLSSPTTSPQHPSKDVVSSSSNSFLPSLGSNSAYVPAPSSLGRSSSLDDWNICMNMDGHNDNNYLSYGSSSPLMQPNSSLCSSPTFGESNINNINFYM